MKILLVDPDINFLQAISDIVQNTFTDLEIVGMIESHRGRWTKAYEMDSDILVLNISDEYFKIMNGNFSHENHYEMIYIVPDYKAAAESIYLGASGFIVKPLSEKEVCRALQNAICKAAKKRAIRSLCEDYITIPSIEGLDLIAKQDIIRCEGLQRCTRIVSADRSDIISSYPIGVFRNLLDSDQFIQTHKSHIVSYRHIRKYLKDGSLTMSDDSSVPVSRRNKNELLNLLKNQMQEPKNQLSMPVV